MDAALKVLIPFFTLMLVVGFVSHPALLVNLVTGLAHQVYVSIASQIGSGSGAN